MSWIIRSITIVVVAVAVDRRAQPTGGDGDDVQVGDQVGEDVDDRVEPLDVG